MQETKQKISFPQSHLTMIVLLPPGDTALLTSCYGVKCHFRAQCQVTDGRAECVCVGSCPTDRKTVMVCGTDGQTYGSACQLRLFSCRLQKEISMAYEGICRSRSTLNICRNRSPVCGIEQCALFSPWLMFISIFTHNIYFI